MFLHRWEDGMTVENKGKLILMNVTLKYLTRSRPKRVHVCWIILWSHFSAGSGGGVPAIGCGRGLAEDAPAVAVPVVVAAVAARACCTETTATLVLATPTRVPVAVATDVCCCSSRLLLSVGHLFLKRHPLHVAWMRTAALCRVPLRSVSSCCRAPSLQGKVNSDISYCIVKTPIYLINTKGKSGKVKW